MVATKIACYNGSVVDIKAGFLQAKFLLGVPATVAAVQKGWNFTLNAKVPPTMAKSAKESNIIFSFFIKLCFFS